MLKIRNLHVDYGSVSALRGVDVELRAGETICVLGANRAGKSTLIRAISGQVAATAGSIEFEGKPITGRPAHAIARLGIVQCPEGRHLFNTMTVRENLLLGLTRWGGRQRDLEEASEQVAEMFPIVRQKWHQQAGSLSGGEQQMVAIGRSLVARPKLLLIDEPSLGLAPKLVRETYRALADVAATGVAILLVEQFIDAALGLAGYGFVLDAGKVRYQGERAELRRWFDENAGYFGTA